MQRCRGSCSTIAQFLLCLILKLQRAHKQAERKLQEERATLTRFDDELKELEGTVKQRKQKISDADLELKQLEHDIVQLNKDKVAAEHQAENLEKQYDWIQDESQ